MSCSSVTVSSGIHTDSGLAVTEEQDIVYRGEERVPRGAPSVQAPTSATGGFAAAPPTGAAPLSGPLPWSRSIVADEVMLFRYSALTYNGHRIHYDLPYASGVEGYPALVVNGGLVTLMLYELLRSHADPAVRRMSSRNMRPLFAGRPIRLEGEPVQGGARLQVLDDSSAVAISAQVEWAS